MRPADVDSPLVLLRWPNGYGVCLRNRRFRVRVPGEASSCRSHTRPLSCTPSGARGRGRFLRSWSRPAPGFEPRGLPTRAAVSTAASRRVNRRGGSRAPSGELPPQPTTARPCHRAARHGAPRARSTAQNAMAPSGREKHNHHPRQQQPPTDHQPPPTNRPPAPTATTTRKRTNYLKKLKRETTTRPQRRRHRRRRHRRRHRRHHRNRRRRPLTATA